MNHDQATQYFAELGELVPDRRRSMDTLIDSGKRERRRRTRRFMALTGAALALVVGGGAAVQQAGTSKSDHAADRAPADAPPATATVPDERPTGLPGESPIAEVSCPPLTVALSSPDPADVPAPADAQGLAVNESGTVAAWFEPMSSPSPPLPFLVVYDLVAAKELAREDLGVSEDRRSSTLQVGEDAVYFQARADDNVWLQYRWGVDDAPVVYGVCQG